MKKILLLCVACALVLGGCINVERRDHHDHDRYNDCVRDHGPRYCERWR